MSSIGALQSKVKILARMINRADSLLTKTFNETDRLREIFDDEEIRLLRHVIYIFQRNSTRERKKAQTEIEGLVMDEDEVNMVAIRRLFN